MDGKFGGKEASEDVFFDVCSVADSQWQGDGRNMLVWSGNIGCTYFFYVQVYGLQPEKGAAAVSSGTSSPSGCL